MSNEEKQIQTATTQALENQNIPLGFEDEESDDVIIPRVKVVQALSPERKDKIADEGDIINSLTKEKLNGKNFVPVFKFTNNILWHPREDGGGIDCQARDGKTGENIQGMCTSCKVCRKNEFDNTKQGKDAIPACTKYMNFFGFFEGERFPIILSFAKTNYSEGKKLFSLAKVTMQNMFNNKYTLTEKEVSNNGNDWFIIDVKAAGPTDEEDRAFALNLYKTYKSQITTVNIDLENAVGGTNDIVDEENFSPENDASTEY